VSLFATERLPQPFAVDGVVTNDLPSRSLGVRLSETASGYERLWWKQAWLQLKAGWEDGWRNHGHVRAGAFGDREIAIVHPGDFQSLVSRPGLVAVATIDRNTSRFLSVQFRNRP
jgi:hypothetical protein